MPLASRRYPQLPVAGGSPREVADAVRMLAQGRLQSIKTVELSTGTTTTVQDDLIAAQSVVSVSPVSASAAGVAWWISGQVDGAFTINHAAGAAGRLVRVAWIG